MKKILNSLPGRIAVAIVLGILAGMVLPRPWAAAAATFNGLMGQFLGFMIPLIIVGFVAPAIADVGRRAGRLLVVTALLAYVATFLAGMMSYGVGRLTFPMIISPGFAESAAEAEAAQVAPWFEVSVPALMPVTTALATAFLLGLGCAVCRASALQRGLTELRDIVALSIDRAVLPLLPPYIGCIFLVMTVEGRVASILATFAGIIGIIFAMHVLILLLQYAIAGAIGRRNPLRMLRTMLPAYLTALGTQSSAATIPVTLRQTERLGVDRGCGRLHRAPVRHHPHERQHAQDSGLCHGPYDDARPGLPARPLRPLHSHARHHHHSRSGHTRRRHHGLAGPAGLHPRIRPAHAGHDDSPLHSHGQFRHRLQRHRRRRSGRHHRPLFRPTHELRPYFLRFLNSVMPNIVVLL